MSTVTKLRDDAHCFVCGNENVHGLRLQWRTNGTMTESEFFPTKAHQGWKGIVHGGILAAVLDEAMTRLAWETYGGAVTAEIAVRYFNPARIGERLTIRGEVGNLRNRLIPAKAEIRNASGRLVASATGKAVKPKSTDHT